MVKAMQATDFMRAAGETPLTPLQLQGLQKVIRQRLLMPWDSQLRRSAGVYEQMGLVTVSTAKSDNLRGGGGNLICELTEKGRRKMNIERAR